MSQYKDFQGKTLDEAIREACDYYGVPREKLEIEIVSDAKSGIFGLVGAKKASIRAARVQIGSGISLLDEEPGLLSGSGKSPADSEKPATPSRNGNTEKRASGKKPAQAAQEKESAGSAAGDPAVGNAAASRQRSPRKGDMQAEKNRKQEKADRARPESGGRERTGRSGDRGIGARSPREAGRDKDRGRDHAGAEARDGLDFFHSGDAAQHIEAAGREDLPEFDLEACNREELAATVQAVVLRLVEPIVGKVPCSVEITPARVRALLDCGDASGLLVGREGQTLASVQYLAARIIARQIGGSLRLHIDAGNYRERQDDRLKELAQSLAAKAKKTRRPQSTRPLSAYQRRIVHLALESDPEVTTRSKGEGAQRRVTVYLERSGAGRPGREERGDGDMAEDFSREMPLNGQGLSPAGSDAFEDLPDVAEEDAGDADPSRRP